MIDLELLIVNANVLTLDGENKKAGSVGVTNGRITGIWSEQTPPSSEVNITERTQRIDLQGATLLPAFIDTHNHMISAVMLRQYLDCKSPPNRDISDIQSRIKQRALSVEKGSWIVGFGYDDTALSDMRHPTKKELDEAAPDHPVIIYHISGHLGVANSLALERAGVNEQTTDPEGGSFGRDEEGHLNGLLYEGTAQAVGAYAPEPSERELLSLISEESLSYLSQGITTNTDAKIGITNEIDDLELCFKAIEQGRLPMHMKLMIASDRLRAGGQMGLMTAHEVDAYIRKRSGGRASLDSAKMFQDGSIQGLTGALREPYFNDPDVLGDLIHDQGELNAEVKDLHDRGFRIAIHGNGDRAIGSILDAFEQAILDNPRPDHRHRIEHVQTATTEDLIRMHELGVAGSFFINHVYYWGDRHEKIFLGPKRGRRINPLAEAAEHNVLFTLHSDEPVTPISPLFSVWVAVNRLTSDGKILGPEQRIDVVTALRAMTSYGAKLIFEEDEVGTIELGKRADFVILAEDPTSIDPLYLKDISIVGTLIDGQIVYDNGLNLIKNNLA